MSRFPKQICSLLLLSWILVGCHMGPDYEPPQIAVPCQWSHEPTEDMDFSSPDSFIWWEALQDPLLNSLIERASRQNLDLQIAMTRVLEARKQKEGKKASLYPHVDGSASIGGLHFNQKGGVEDLLSSTCDRKKNNQVNTGFFEIGFDADWEIDLFGRIRHELSALKAKEEASLETVQDSWVTLSAEIGKNYMELRGFQIRLELINQNIESQQDHLWLVQNLFKIGMVDRIELLGAEEGLNRLIAERPLIELSISHSIYRLSVLLGYPPQDLFSELCIVKALPCLPNKKPIGVPSELLRRRPDIRRAERELAAATEGIGAAIASLFPHLSLRGFVGDITTHLHSLLHPTSAVLFGGPQLLLPIFNSKYLIQDVDYQKIRTRQALYEYQKTVLLALEETEKAIASFQYELKRNASLAAAQEAHREAYRLTLNLYQRGLKNYIEVLVQHRSLLVIEEVFIQSQVSLLMHYISIYKALGGGWEIACPN
jgi:multidrug efflux system outer membrane protein